jgi:hypothetical protein
MGNTDGTVLGASKILDHGSDSDRWTMVLVSEGYQASEISQFQTDAQNFVNTFLTTAPFDTLQAAVNVYRLDVTSTDSGADDPVACGGTGATPATYFDATFCIDDVPRLLDVDTASVLATVSATVPAWNMIMVLVNTPKFGGRGGPVAVFSRHNLAKEIGLHEMGHTAFGLADEYPYLLGCDIDTDRDHHPQVEPDAVNVTIDSNRATIKWGDLILTTTPMPTTTNADCSECDPQPNPLGPTTVGAYEGADTYHCDAFRPQFTCRMRELGKPFCVVCARRIVKTLTPHLPPKLVLKDIKEHKHEKFEKHEVEVVKQWAFEHYKQPGMEAFPVDRADLVERLSRIEATLEQLMHFIPREQRPDLGRGALVQEPDVSPAVPRVTRNRAAGKRKGRGRQSR